MLEEAKYRLIRTPLERPLLVVREVMKSYRWVRHPELREIYREPWRISRALKRLIKPDANCLDIGAHYGSTLSAIVRLAPRGRHAAVEAVPRKAEFLRAKFPEVDIYNLALSSASGTVDFFINTRRTGFSGLAAHGDPGDAFERIEVPCQSLDALMEGRPRVNFVKIDVEGAEEMVLSSGRAFLAEHAPALLFECGPSGARNYGRKPGDLFHLLVDQLDYEVFLPRNYLLGGPPSDLRAFEKALEYPFQAFNWIGVPRTRLD